MKIPSSLQKLRDRVTSRRILPPRHSFTKRTESAPSCLHDVNMRVLTELPTPAKKRKLFSSHSFNLKSLKPTTNTPTPGTKNPRSLPTPEPDSDTPIPRSSLQLVRSNSKRRRRSVAVPLPPVCEDVCPDENCLMCSLVKPELKRRHSTIIIPSFMRNFD